MYKSQERADVILGMQGHLRLEATSRMPDRIN